MSKPVIRNRKSPRAFSPRWRVWLVVVACALAMLTLWAILRGCGSEREVDSIPLPTDSDKGEVLVTGYCNCGDCCGWKRSWLGFGQPVYNYGPMKGKPKEVGVTARGTVARHGTIAADPKVYPFGTRLVIPGYGTGVVEDVGGAIKGRHIDVWFPSHQAALKWGRRMLKVEKLAK